MSYTITSAPSLTDQFAGGNAVRHSRKIVVNTRNGNGKGNEDDLVSEFHDYVLKY